MQRKSRRRELLSYESYKYRKNDTASSRPCLRFHSFGSQSVREDINMATFLRLSLRGRVVLTRLGQNHKTSNTVRCASTGRDVTKVPDNSIDKSEELKVLEKHFADSDPTKLKVQYQNIVVDLSFLTQNQANN